MISGFINVGMGWKWTLWWCSIFNAFAFIYCFFLMEETNYDRKFDNHPIQTSTACEQVPSGSGNLKNEKSRPTSQEDREIGEIQWPRKTYLNKLSLEDKPRPNRLLEIMWAPFKGFTYPSVVFAG